VNGGIDMRGKVALVTGAGQGMGRAAAVRFAEADAKVVVADIAEETSAETVRQIEELGGEAAFIATDVRDEDAVASMVQFAVDRFGRLDYANNNAGGSVVGSASSIAAGSGDDWNAIVDLNLKGVFLCLRQELARIGASGGGAIVNTASAAAYRGGVSSPSYTAAKHGVAGLTKAAALEGVGQGVRVNAVCPGVTITEGLLARHYASDDFSRVEDLARKNQPLGRLIQPSEIAEAVVWLCSEGASAITGAIVPVDGGMSAI
jgi:NAD(P)-dependent dehydrogenase (short-subunit alcohol dehydrogenase family)